MGKLTLLGLLSWAGYLVATFILQYYSSARDVISFLGLFAFLFLVYGLAYRQIRSLSGRAVLVQILLWALVFRATLLFVGLPPHQRWDGLKTDLSGEGAGYEQFLIYDHDVWRFLWDGHLSANGVDPYAHTPQQIEESEDPKLEALLEESPWEDILYNQGFPSFTTVYPPLAQGLFRLSHWLAPGSVFCFKLLILVLDMATCFWLLGALIKLGRSGAEVLLYAWNPLIVKEFSGSAHVDPLMLMFLAAAVYLVLARREKLSLLALGLAVCARLTPILVVPFFLKRVSWKLWPLVAVPPLLSYALYWSSLDAMVDGFAAFAGAWSFNPGIYALLHWLLGDLARPLCGVIILGIAAWLWFRQDEQVSTLMRSCFFAFAALLLLSPAAMPWYLSWALLFGVLAGDRLWPVLTGLSMLSYLIYINQVEQAWWLWLEYGLFFGVVLYSFWVKPLNFEAKSGV